MAGVLATVCADPSRISPAVLEQHVEVARRRFGYTEADREFTLASRSVGVRGRLRHRPRLPARDRLGPLPGAGPARPARPAGSGRGGPEGGAHPPGLVAGRTPGRGSCAAARSPRGVRDRDRANGSSRRQAAPRPGQPSRQATSVRGIRRSYRVHLSFTEAVTRLGGRPASVSPGRGGGMSAAGGGRGRMPQDREPRGGGRPAPGAAAAHRAGARGRRRGGRGLDDRGRCTPCSTACPSPVGDVNLIVGTSAGSVLAAALRCGVTLDEHDRPAARRADARCSARRACATWTRDRCRRGRSLRAGSPRLILTTLRAPRTGSIPGVGASAWLPRGRGRHEALHAMVAALDTHRRPAAARPEPRVLGRRPDLDRGRGLRHRDGG